MSLAICVLLTWAVIILLSLIPKKLSEMDMVFLYFVNTIFEISIFSYLIVNLKWIEVNHHLEASIADLVLRLIMIPLVFVVTANLMMYPWKILKWLLVLLVILSFLGIQNMLRKFGIISVHHWNAAYTLLLYCSFTLFSSLMAWLINNVEKKEVSES